MSLHRPIIAGEWPGAHRMRIDFRDGGGDIWPFYVPVALARCIGRYPRIDGIEAGGPLIVFHAADE